jgi:hypothetical protein
MTDFRALCAELLEWAERTSSHYYKQADVVVRARAALAERPVGPTDEELLELWKGWNLGWDPQEGTVLMPHPAEYARAVLARWGSVQLGEVNGKYSCAGTTLEEAVRKLANALPAPSLKEQALKALKVLPTPEGQVTLDITDLNTIRRALEQL